jgi:hypothetical protein
MTNAEIFFSELINEIPNAKPGKMFGALCIKMPNGKSAAMFRKDNIVVKLPEEILQEAIGLKGARLFEPMEGRPMKEWVQVPFDHKSKWKTYAEISARSVEAVKKKAVKKKK